MSRPFALLLTTGALLWAAAILAVPMAHARPAWSAPASALHRAAAGICHQRPERSFHLAGMQMPVCARCAGLYLAGAAGALLGWTAFARRGVDQSRAWLLVAAVPTAVTWTLESAGLASFSNAARAAAALPLGLVAGWLFVGMLRYDAALHADEVHDSRTRARSA